MHTFAAHSRSCWKVTQFRSPKQPWGSKRYNRYEWLLLDTTTVDGHRVDILQFSSLPPKGLQERVRGGEIGKIWVIEDYWRIIGVERQFLKNNSMMSTHLEQIAPGVFLPSEMTCLENYQMEVATMLEVMGINPDSLSIKQQKKLMEKVAKLGDVSMSDGYSIKMRYDNVVTKE